ncbi:MAG TPA: hypothetical protein CFH84_05520 [Sulfurimonas sp. UBA12504]|nr:MAG: hypothetical protein A2019_08360 [Sulfurimonas sp. GWF2_37_8]DAB30165.1 MAG TPA: hypothetical protein CFH84_05520 [Sulfurimonas sp. UBA12504]
MLNTNDYELLKENFIASQALFMKLRSVVYHASNIEYDGVGFYVDEEKMYKRHREKLRLKIFQSISAALTLYDIKLLENKDDASYTLTLMLSFRDIQSLLRIDFTEENTLDIIQLS